MNDRVQESVIKKLKQDYQADVGRKDQLVIIGVNLNFNSSNGKLSIAVSRGLWAMGYNLKFKI